MLGDDARQRILGSAKAIFLEQGYKKTTIRQIVRRSGLLIGSIYHFFENKEDIFQQLFFDLFDRCDTLISKGFGETADPPFRLAFMCATMLQAGELNENICELYCELLSLHGPAETHARHFAGWLRRNLRQELEGQPESEIFARAMAISGVLRGLLANRYSAQKVPLPESIRIMVESAFAILGIPGRSAQEMQRLAGLQKELVATAEALAERRLTGTA